MITVQDAIITRKSVRSFKKKNPTILDTTSLPLGSRAFERTKSN